MWQNSSGCCCLWSGNAWVKHATGLFFFIELINFTKIILGKKYTCRSIDWKWQIWSIFTSICSKIRFSKFNANRIFCLQKQNLLWIIRTILCHNTVQQLQWDFMFSYAFRTTLSFFYSFHTCHTCHTRRSHQRLISAVGLFPAIWRLSLYWISTRLHLFNTNTERWHQLQNKLLWNDLLKAKPKRQPSLGSMPIFLIAWAPGAVIPQSSVVQSHLLVTYR